MMCGVEDPGQLDGLDSDFIDAASFISDLWLADQISWSGAQI
jgi:hypothetical protein